MRPSTTAFVGEPVLAHVLILQVPDLPTVIRAMGECQLSASETGDDEAPQEVLPSENSARQNMIPPPKRRPRALQSSHGNRNPSLEYNDQRVCAAPPIRAAPSKDASHTWDRQLAIAQPHRQLPDPPQRIIRFHHTVSSKSHTRFLIDLGDRALRCVMCYGVSYMTTPAGKSSKLSTLEPAFCFCFLLARSGRLSGRRLTHKLCRVVSSS